MRQQKKIKQRLTITGGILSVYLHFREIERHYLSIAFPSRSQKQEYLLTPESSERIIHHMKKYLRLREKFLKKMQKILKKFGVRLLTRTFSCNEVAVSEFERALMTLSSLGDEYPELRDALEYLGEHVIMGFWEGYYEETPLPYKELRQKKQEIVFMLNMLMNEENAKRKYPLLDTSFHKRDAQKRTQTSFNFDDYSLN